MNCDLRLTALLVASLAACGGTSPAADADANAGDAMQLADGSSDASSDTTSDAAGDATSDACTLLENTSTTSTVTNGCALRTRDVSACNAARVAAGLSGAWLKFSCRVSLAVTTVSGASVVQVSTDSRPDYTSNYFPTTDACYAPYTTAFPDPNEIVAENIVMNVPATPGGAGRTMAGLGVVGVAINGVSIFSNQAAPGDDIYTEAGSFDQCQGHPNPIAYHYHTEPYSISYDDAALIGVMRDGWFVYGRRDADGTMPTLDANGGHTGTTPDSATPVYHYHVNLQTSTNTGTAGQMQWFLTTGAFAMAPGTCSSGCGDH